MYVCMYLLVRRVAVASAGKGKSARSELVSLLAFFRPTVGSLFDFKSNVYSSKMDYRVKIRREKRIFIRTRNGRVRIRPVIWRFSRSRMPSPVHSSRNGVFYSVILEAILASFVGGASRRVDEKMRRAVPQGRVRAAASTNFVRRRAPYSVLHPRSIFVTVSYFFSEGAVDSRHFVRDFWNRGETRRKLAACFSSFRSRRR